MKRCKQCGERKEMRYFHSRKRKDGTMYYTPTCSACIMRNWRKRNPGVAQQNDKKNNQKKLEQVMVKKAMLMESISQKECRRCGIDDIRVLSFHHRDPTTKEFTVSDGLRERGWQSLVEEVKKCDILCANCHIIEHAYGCHEYPSSLGTANPGPNLNGLCKGVGTPLENLSAG